MMLDIKCSVAFSHPPGLGTGKFRLRKGFCGFLEHAWIAGLADLRAAGIDDRIFRAIVTHRSSFSISESREKLERANVTALNWNVQDYSPRLKEIPDPPPIIVLPGGPLPNDERSVATVGTRKATAYGREAASLLALDLAGNGVIIVSGMARGIDGIARRAAPETIDRTIDVLGNGLDIVYPSEHVGLARDITQLGELVSEYALGVKPKSTHSPQRNRIISGALRTVRHALEQDREVFRVPGGASSPASRRTNDLIQQGPNWS